MTSVETIELYPYQDLKYNELVYALKHGEKDLLLVMPPSAGKTKTAQYVIGDLCTIDEDYDIVFIVVPLTAIKTAWLEPVNIVRPSNKAYTVEYRAEEFNDSKLLVDNSFWTNTKQKIFVISRALFGSLEFLDFLLKSKLDFSNVLIVPDEGHHHADTTLAGKVTNILYKNGATIIKISGTPWHNDGSVINDTTKIILLSNAEYARQKDPITQLYFAPRNWELRKVFVGSNSSSYEEIVGSSETSIISNEFKISFIKTFIQKYIDDNCPKAVVNLPRTSWANDLIISLQENSQIRKILNRNLKIENFTGKNVSLKRKKEMLEILSSESKIQDYNLSRIDIIIACSRMDEGVDWKLCSHVYNVRLPESPRQIIQRWARAGRSKNKIKNYPDQHKDTQSITFFIPQPTEDLKDEVWKRYRNVALLLACYVEDYKTAEIWADGNSKVSNYLTLLQEKKVNQPKIEKAKGEALNEINKSKNQILPLEKANALKEITELILQNSDRSILSLIKIIESKFQKGTKEYELMVKTLLEYAAEKNEELKDRMLDLRRRNSFNLIKTDLITEFEDIAKNFENLIVVKSDGILETSIIFSAFKAEEIARAFRKKIDFSFTIDLILEESEKFKNIKGCYPVVRSGEWEGFQGKTWEQANSWLKYNKNTNLRKLFGKKEKKSFLVYLDEILEFRQKEGFWPPHGHPLYVAFSTIRKLPEYKQVLQGHFPGKRLTNRLNAEQKIEKLLDFQRKNNNNKIMPSDKPYFNYCRWFVENDKIYMLEQAGINYQAEGKKS